MDRLGLDFPDSFVVPPARGDSGLNYSRAREPLIIALVFSSAPTTALRFEDGGARLITEARESESCRKLTAADTPTAGSTLRAVNYRKIASRRGKWQIRGWEASRRHLVAPTTDEESSMSASATPRPSPFQRERRWFFLTRIATETRSRVFLFVAQISLGSMRSLTGIDSDHCPSSSFNASLGITIVIPFPPRLP